MAATNWIAAHWLDFIQNVGIIGSLLITAYAAFKDERGRRVSNSIAIEGHYQRLWRLPLIVPELERVLDRNADLQKQPLSFKEERFVVMLTAHMSTTFRAKAHGEFVKLDGLKVDARDFFSLPIPKVVWAKIKRFQDDDFVDFVEET